MRAVRGRSRWILRMVTTIVVAAGLGLLRYHPTYSLLQHAAAVGSVPDESTIYWLSDHEFIAGEFVRPNHFRGTHYDTRNGTQKHIEQTITPERLQQSAGANEFVTQSLAPEHYVNVSAWNQQQIDAARANAGTVNLVGMFSLTVPGTPKSPRSHRAITLHSDCDFSIRLPTRLSAFLFLFSPRKDYWMTAITNVRASPLPVWLHRYLPRGGVQDIESLYIGRTDGTGTRCLGDVPVSPIWDTQGHEISNGIHIRNIQWLADGWHVSFVYNGVIYTLPIK